MRLSYSLLDGFRTCEFRTYLELKKVPTLTRPGLAEGSVIHACNEAVLLGKNVKAAARREARRHVDYWIEQGDDPTDKTAMCADVASRWAQWFKPQEKIMLLPGKKPGTYLTEQYVNVPLDPPIGVFNSFVLKADVLCLRLINGSWTRTVLDFKTSRSSKKLHDVTQVDYNLQLFMYAWGLQAAGHKPFHAGNLMYQKVGWPEAPQLLKNGKLSRAAITTDWPTYQKAIDEAGLDPEDYHDVKLKLLDGQRNPFFADYILHLGESEVKAVWNKIVVPLALKLSDCIEGEAPFVRHRDTFPCSYCTYREPCYTGLLGINDEEVFNA